MKNIILIALFFFSLSVVSQRVQEYPYSAKFYGNIEARDSIIASELRASGADSININDVLRLSGLFIITDDTYTLVADASGNVGYYGEEPTITLNLNTYLTEFGSSTTITASGVVTNTISATFSNGYVWDANDARSNTFTLVANAYSTGITLDFEPVEGGIESNTYTANIDWVSGTNSGTATANRTINACYPVFYGMSATDRTTASGTDIYLDAGFTKELWTEDDLSIPFDDGPGKYPYVVIPTVWSDTTFSQILDESSYDVTDGWTSYRVYISSSGLTNDYINVPYRLWCKYEKTEIHGTWTFNQ